MKPNTTSGPGPGSNKKGAMSSLIMGIVGALVVLGMVGGGAYLVNQMNGDGSGDTLSLTSDALAENDPWKDRNVPVSIELSDKLTGSDVNPTVKIYEEQPENFGNPGASFDDASKYETVSISNGSGEYSDNPGTYFMVVEAAGYNDEFAEVFVPGKRNVGAESLSDYKAGQAVREYELLQTGDLAVTDADQTLSNESNVEDTTTGELEAAEDTEFRGRDVIVTDKIGFANDADNDGIGDEGIDEYSVVIRDPTGSIVEEVTLYDADGGVDKFDTNDEYRVDLGDFTATDEEQFEVDFEWVADQTKDSNHAASSDDEILTEGEGTIAQLEFFGDQDTKRGTLAHKS